MTFPLQPFSFPSPPTLHQTVTALWGVVPPLNSNADWEANPGGLTIARFFTNLVIRGCTALTDDPVIVFRPYIRSWAAGAAGYVGMGESVSYTRPRVRDLTTIKLQKTVNNGAAYTDYSANVVDNNVATFANLNSLDTVANGDWVVIGFTVPFCGAALDMTANVNANASVMTVEYWNGAAWVAVANLTDGTAAGGVSLAADGQISWDIPAAWAASTINALTAYWVRVSFSAALDAATEIAEVDIFTPLQAAIDVITDGDDAFLAMENQSAAVTGTVAYSGTVYVSWR